VKDITDEPWMKNFTSTGSDRPYYTWTGKNIKVRGHRTDQRLQLLRDKLPGFFKGKVVFDIGCNLGMMSHFAADSGAKKVVGFEGCSKTAEAAAKIVELEQADITILHRNLGQEAISDSCDIALCFSVLHHINPKYKIFEFLNNRVKESIIIEAHHLEEAWGSIVTPGQEWQFESVKDMLKKLKDRYLTNFVVAQHIGIATDTKRPRNVYKWDRVK
jgi:2-polyprenyl-3-methyl-5-hydroxy-6-metoxy-1,4-benzoquinol methylase